MRTWDASRSIRFVLNDALEHPFYWWPRTLLTYPIEFKEPVDFSQLILTRVDTKEAIPFQFSEVEKDQNGLQTATLNFFSDLPSGARILEYAVAAVNGNGEGPMSAIADTDPSSWRNWNPRPDEGFRRVYSYGEGSVEEPGAQPRYYPE